MEYILNNLFQCEETGTCSFKSGKVGTCSSSISSIRTIFIQECPMC